jgi:hypothetical protein
VFSLKGQPCDLNGDLLTQLKCTAEEKEEEEEEEEEEDNT